MTFAASSPLLQGDLDTERQPAATPRGAGPARRPANELRLRGGALLRVLDTLSQARRIVPWSTNPRIGGITRMANACCRWMQTEARRRLLIVTAVVLLSACGGQSQDASSIATRECRAVSSLLAARHPDWARIVDEAKSAEKAARRAIEWENETNGTNANRFHRIADAMGGLQRESAATMAGPNARFVAASCQPKR